MSDQLLRGILHKPNLRFVVCDTTAICQEALRRQKCPIIAMEALGRTLTAAALLSAALKGKERLSIQISSPEEAMIRAVFVDASPGGKLRGYVSFQKVLASPAVRAFTLAEAVGKKGVLNVLHDDGSGEFYRGLASLTHGTIDQDIASYLDSSVQIPSLMALSILFDKGQVVSAAGVLVQVLPGGDVERLKQLKAEINSERLTQILQKDTYTIGQLAAELLPLDDDLEVFDASEVEFYCACSKERATRALLTVGVDEIQSIIDEQHGSSITCEFCGNTYHFSEEDLLLIKTQLKSPLN
jgi:molecular chaperone Hsp33